MAWLLNNYCDVNSLELFNRLYGYIFNIITSFILVSISFPYFKKKKWRISESNRWPPACKAGALASWANPPSVMIYLLFKNLSFRSSPVQIWTGDLYIISVAL